MSTRHGRCAVLAALVLLAGCSSAPGSSDAAPTRTAPRSSASPVETEPPAVTARLDSIAVIGHSGATGAGSNPDQPTGDANANSWATGENPDVDSLYRRLLEDHPAMRGHNFNYAVNGTAVDDLHSQLRTLLTLSDPLPDVVVVQTIDNDMRCDGTDADHYRPYGRALDRVLSFAERRIPGVQFFVPGQWASVEVWSAWAAHHKPLVRENSGSGPCAVFTGQGRVRPAGVRSMQAIVDGYWRQVERVCAAHPGCFTDGGAEQERFVPADRDVTADLNHLSIAGARKYAAIAWAAFPDEIKQRR